VNRCSGCGRLFDPAIGGLDVCAVCDPYCVTCRTGVCAGHVVVKPHIRVKTTVGSAA
jgi:hypothetical protein